MEKYITSIEDFESREIGAKARNLFLMKKNGLNVPDMFCVRQECLEVIGTEEEKALEESVLKYLADNFAGSEYFSVRSSCSMEDGADYSFAGQFKTYLNVPAEKIFEHVFKCYESLRLPNVLKYCCEKNIPAEALKMSVVVQEMINSDMSGVIFTANPQGLLNETVIVCGKGTGDAVVEDKVPVTSYYYNKTDKIYYYETQPNAPVLEIGIFNKLIETVNGITKILGDYLDIEFAVSGNEVYILQARPITTLNTGKKIILDNSNIVESYPNITLPLTFSFISEAYFKVFRGVASRLLKNGKLVEKYDDTLRQMVDTSNGRVYYKISNWYTVLKFLPFSGKIIPVWQEMMGVSDKKYDYKENGISYFQRIKIYINAFREALNVPKGMDELNEHFIETDKFFKQNYSADLTNEKLAALYENIKERLLNGWDITLLNDMYAFIFTGLLKRSLKKAIKNDYECETNKYISGISNIESMKPVKELVKLANCVADSDILINDLSDLKDDKSVIDYMAESKSDFADKLKMYIEIYGDRSLEELKLESVTFKSSPLLLIKKLLDYTEDADKLARLSRALETEKTCGLPENCGFIGRKLIKFFSSRAMLGIKNREISRLNRSRIYGMVRSIFLSVGENFYRDNLIDGKRDIFYLNIEEIFGFIKGNDINFRLLIEKRKAEYKIYEKLPAYSRLVFAENVFNKNHLNINSVDVSESRKEIIGVPCSNGLVTGEVAVINNAKEAGNVKDKILVTKMTDPGWVFLLSMAKGIITEKGSLLSHTAIISRELNIPSIVGVKNITSILKTGDTVTMNGGTGEIEIVGGVQCIKP